MGRPPQNERFDLAPEECGDFRQEISTLLKQLIHFGRFKITSRDLPTPLYNLDPGRAYVGVVYIPSQVILICSQA